MYRKIVQSNIRETDDRLRETHYFCKYRDTKQNDMFLQ